MSGVTGIELGPNYCVLVRGGRARSRRTVVAASTIMPAAWSGDSSALADAAARGRQRDETVAVRARVVAWGRRRDASSRVSPRPALRSGIRDRRAVARAGAGRSGPGAAGRSLPPGTAVAALSLNTHGAAIAIVAGTEVIRSASSSGRSGAVHDRRTKRSELLDRYLLVSQIAPQLQHVIDLVRPVVRRRPSRRSSPAAICRTCGRWRCSSSRRWTSRSRRWTRRSCSIRRSAEHVRRLGGVAAARCRRRVVWREPRPGSRRERRRHRGSARAPSSTRASVFGIVTRLQRLAAFAALVFCSTWSFMQVVRVVDRRVRCFPAGLEQPRSAERGRVAAVRA